MEINSNGCFPGRSKWIAECIDATDWPFLFAKFSVVIFAENGISGYCAISRLYRLPKSLLHFMLILWLCFTHN